MEPLQAKSSPKLRLGIILGGLVLLALWGWALVPLFTSWNDPRADGFQLIPTFWATLTALPLGVMTLFGGIAGREKDIRLAKTCLTIAAGLAVVVAALEIFRRLSGGD